MKGRILLAAVVCSVTLPWAPMLAQVPSGIKQIQLVDLPSPTGQTYRLWVSLPASYQHSPQSYPVLYILDADFNFLHLANQYRQLEQANQVAEAIVIGIGYGTVFLEKGNNRYQDFSPTYLAKYPGSGRAENFRDFLDDTLLPFVKQQYRIRGKSTIHGHSMAGLFLTYLLFVQPDLFDQYLITSPALWWDKRKIFTYEQTRWTQHKELKAAVFLTVGGKESRRMRKDWQTLKVTLADRKYQGLVLETKHYPDHSHIGVIPEAVTEGLLYFGNKCR